MHDNQHQIAWGAVRRRYVLTSISVKTHFCCFHICCHYSADCPRFTVVHVHWHNVTLKNRYIISSDKDILNIFIILWKADFAWTILSDVQIILGKHAGLNVHIVVFKYWIFLMNAHFWYWCPINARSNRLLNLAPQIEYVARFKDKIILIRNVLY